MGCWLNWTWYELLHKFCLSSLTKYETHKLPCMTNNTESCKFINTSISSSTFFLSLFFFSIWTSLCILDVRYDYPILDIQISLNGIFWDTDISLEFSDFKRNNRNFQDFASLRDRVWPAQAPVGYPVIEILLLLYSVTLRGPPTLHKCYIFRF